MASAEGEQLLRAARDRTGWHGQEAPERQEQAPTRLCDQRGNGIRDESHLATILDDADDAVWLVPAIALTGSLEDDGIVHRRVEEGPPVETHYSLTEKGTALEPVFDAIDEWNTEWVGEIDD